MSHETYNILWSEAQEILEEVTKIDVEEQSSKPTKDKVLAHNVVCGMYAKYIICINKLDQCYDQIVQPQKRLLIRRILDATIGRFIELKHELVNLDISEFNYFDDILSNMRILPQEVEVNVPAYYKRERATEIYERKKMIEDTLRQLGFDDEMPRGLVMTELEAIRLIQIHERARQGRLRAQFMKEIRQMKEIVKPESESEKSESGRQSALKIQRVWRGFITRRKIRKRVVEEMLLIGMLQPSHTDTEQRDHAEEVKKLRRKVQEKHEEEYQEALVREKNLVRKQKAGKMMEDIKDQVRSWYMSYKAQTGKFPDLPSEESGGSALIFSRQGADSEISKATTPSSKDSKGKKDKTKKGTKEKDDMKKKKQDDEEDPGFKMGPSNFLTDLMVANTEYDEEWKEKNESDNPSQKYYLDMIKTQKTAEIEAEIRKIVDEELRVELELLQAALDRDRAKKGKKGKKASKKKKSRRSGKKGKKKKEKDLTPDRTLDSLFEELVVNGIIKRYPETPLSSFRGEKSYANYELRLQGNDPQPSLGDVRQVMLEYCILPLGSKTVHQTAPMVRSLLLTGPHGSGKKMLVHAVCTEIGGVLFDLSPANIVGKYPGKSGLIMLVHLVNKVARLVQPSIIFMDGGEKPFLKKVPKTDKTDPKRLKKDLPKIVKGITQEDQIMLIGTSFCPWECDQKLLAQTYHKMILIPKPDYASLSFLWAEQLFQYSGVNRQFDTCALAKISDGFTVGAIINAIKEVMTCKRVLQLRIQPLTHAEIINVLSRFEPVYKEEEEAFMQWYAKTPIGRKKQRALELLEVEKYMENEMQKKKK
ncbi:unnamed protein product [Bemisia tabaci]|uniref:ATPase AAA-type core domain-containing protein n=1 Tax=Bemisia tabaci TaxID=7038 RepID=A0A9P0AEJ8_BEMTA|nr:unnamed protein product [Bemisia tabaci]